ncbi:MAG: hypothetical protein ABW004_14825, partial [Aeromicrobium sp.]
TPPPRGLRPLIGLIVASAVLVLGLGVTAVVVLVRAGDDPDIPRVTDITASRVDGAVDFAWDDPGLADGDLYQIRVDGGASSIQSAPSFRADGSSVGPVCITVTVNRDGRTGEPSSEKCLDVPAE